MASNDKTLDLAITQIEKQYGKGSIMKLNEEVVVECNGISTGSISLDAAVGIGGVPRGRIVEIYGPESSGKTTLTLHIIAQAQKVSVSFIQRKLSIGYNRAARMVEQMEEEGIVGPPNGSKPREVLIKDLSA